MVTCIKTKRLHDAAMWAALYGEKLWAKERSATRRCVDRREHTNVKAVKKKHYVRFMVK